MDLNLFNWRSWVPWRKKDIGDETFEKEYKELEKIRDKLMKETDEETAAKEINANESSDDIANNLSDYELYKHVTKSF